MEKTDRGGKRIREQRSTNSAKLSSAGDVTRRMVTEDKETAECHHRFKYYAETWVTSVFKQMSRMQTLMQVLIAACIQSMVSLVPTIAPREPETQQI